MGRTNTLCFFFRVALLATSSCIPACKSSIDAGEQLATSHFGLGGELGERREMGKLQI